MTQEAEAYILGSVLQEPSTLKSISLEVDDFSLESNREIFSAMHSVNIPEILSVNEELEKRTGHNWLGILAQIQSNSIGARYLSEYQEQIKKSTMRRKAKCIADDLIFSLDNKEDDSIDLAITKSMSLSKPKTSYEKVLKATLKDVIDHIEDTIDGKRSGVSTGFKSLDDVLGCFYDSDLVVIGARPAMGKTALLINMMMSAGKPVGIISSEQSSLQIGQRILSSASDVAAYKFRNGKLSSSDYTNLSSAIGRLVDNEVYFYDEPSPTISTVQRQARQWKHKYNISALYVDYIQRLEATEKRQNRTVQIGEIVRGLKSLARELDIPIVALSQVSRAVESRPDKRPHMGDLSDSSEIEKEADIVALLYRDEVYNSDTHCKGVAELLIDKNRHGGTGRINMQWNAQVLTFSDMGR